MLGVVLFASRGGLELQTKEDCKGRKDCSSKEGVEGEK